MALPQLQAALKACDRRDAALALRSLSVTHAAYAPLVAGDKGKSTFDKCAAGLRSILKLGSSKVDKPFKRLMADARGR